MARHRIPQTSSIPMSTSALPCSLAHPEAGGCSTEVESFVRSVLSRESSGEKDGRAPDEPTSLVPDLSRRNFLVGGCMLLAAAVTGAAALRSAGTSTATPAGATQEGDVRLVKHAMGESWVPANPERVVVLGQGELESVAALHFRPVGSVRLTDGQGSPTYLTFADRDAKRVGTTDQPDLNAIAEVKPDLILGNRLHHEAMYGPLTQIAPTVLTANSGTTWKEDFLLHGEALGARPKAEQLLRSYGQLLEDFKLAMDEKLAATQVSVVRFLPNEVRAYGKASFIGAILEEAGLPRPQSQNVQQVEERISVGRLGAIDGDVMFVMPSLPNEITSLPQWGELNAVQQGEVHTVGEWPWGLGRGALAAGLIVGYLHRILIEQSTLADPSCTCKRSVSQS